MSVDTTLAVLYAQSNLTNAANVAMVAPQASLAMTRVLAAEAMRQERQQVEKNEKSEQAGIRNDDGEGGGRARYGRLLARRRHEAEAEAEPPKTPFVGNLLNVKV